MLLSVISDGTDSCIESILDNAKCFCMNYFRYKMGDIVGSYKCHGPTMVTVTCRFHDCG